MELGASICFGDIIQLRTKLEDGTAATLSFMDQHGKDQPLLVLPASSSPADAKLVEAEFIVYVLRPTLWAIDWMCLDDPLLVACNDSAPVHGEKQQAPGTPLTYKTPFTLCTTEIDKKSGKEVLYSLNNKVSGHKDGVTLQSAHVKGEMYLTVEKGETVAETVSDRLALVAAPTQRDAHDGVHVACRPCTRRTRSSSLWWSTRTASASR